MAYLELPSPQGPQKSLFSIVSTSVADPAHFLDPVLKNGSGSYLDMFLMFSKIIFFMGFHYQILTSYET